MLATSSRLGDAKRVWTWPDAAIAGLIVAMTIFWWRARGTGDTRIYLNAMAVLGDAGLVEGYGLTRHAVQYPPFSVTLLYIAKRLGAGVISDLVMLKFLLLAFQAAAGILIYRMSRSLRRTLLFLLATVISTTGLGYLDILMAPPIIAMVQFCRENRLVRGTISFLTAMLMKWQPFLLLPGILAWAALTFQPRRLDWRVILGCMTVTVCALATLLGIFGLPFAASFHAGMTQQGWLLNGNAANPFYLVTEVLTFGSGNDNPFVTKAAFPSLWPWVQFFFYTAGAVAFALYVQVEKTVENLVLFSVMFFWCYYLLALGVHENHLALAVFLAFTLAGGERWEQWIIGLTAAAFNLNLAIFYDFNLLNPYIAHIPAWFTLVSRGAASLLNTGAGIVVIALCARRLFRSRSGRWQGILVRARMSGLRPGD